MGPYRRILVTGALVLIISFGNPAFAGEKRCRGFAIIGAGLITIGLLGMAHTLLTNNDGSTNPPGSEPPFLPDGNGSVPDDTIFKDLDPQAKDDFDPKFVTDRTQLQLKRWQNFPSHAQPRAEAKVPQTFLRAAEAYRQSLYQNGGKEGELLSRLSESERDPQRLAKMSAKELWDYAAKLVRNRIDFELVDDTHGRMKLTDYWDIKKGDCDKYRDLTAALFYELKNAAGNTEAVWVLDERFGAGDIDPADVMLGAQGPLRARHAWTAVVGIGEDGKWTVSHLDPTFGRHWYSSVDAYDDQHLDARIWRYHFFKAAGANATLVREFAHEDILKETDPRRHAKKVELVLRAMQGNFEWDRVAAMADFYRKNAKPEQLQAFNDGALHALQPETMLQYQTEAPLIAAVREGKWDDLQEYATREVQALGTLRFQTMSFLSRLKDPRGQKIIDEALRAGLRRRR